MKKILHKIRCAAVTLTVIRGLLALGASIPWVWSQWVSFLYTEKLGLWLVGLPWSEEPLSWLRDGYRLFWEIFGWPAIAVLTVIWLVGKIPVWKLRQLRYWIETVRITARPHHVSRTYVRCLNRHNETDVDIQRLRTAEVDGVLLEYCSRDQSVWATGSKGCKITLTDRFCEVDGLQLAVAKYEH